MLFWIRDNVAVFKKGTQLVIESGDINLSDINRIDIVVGGYYGQGAFRFPMKILHIINNGKRHESIQPVGYRLCKKDNGINFEEYNNQRSWRLNQIIKWINII